MSSLQCNEELPCKRCKDDGLVCFFAPREKVAYKQQLKGYPELLEHNQMTLIATIRKLYAMVRSQQQWDLNEPGLNGNEQPVIHNIASILGCINHSNIPSILEDGASPLEPAHQMEERSQEYAAEENAHSMQLEMSSHCGLPQGSYLSGQCLDFDTIDTAQNFSGEFTMAVPSQRIECDEYSAKAWAPLMADPTRVLPEGVEDTSDLSHQWVNPSLGHDFSPRLAETGFDTIDFMMCSTMNDDAYTW